MATRPACRWAGGIQCSQSASALLSQKSEPGKKLTAWWKPGPNRRHELEKQTEMSAKRLASYAAIFVYWATVLAVCTGLFVLMVEWIREHIPIYGP
jgi:hypothetical protein